MTSPKMQARREEMMAIGAEVAAMISPQAVQTAAEVIFSHVNAGREVPDSVFDDIWRLTISFVELRVPLLRDVGCRNRDIRHFREGARAHFHEQFGLAKAAAMAEGQPN